MIPSSGAPTYWGCYSREALAHYCDPGLPEETNHCLAASLVYDVCEARSVEILDDLGGTIGDVGEPRPN
ncbi:MAG: hypothetical protein NXI30_28315 [bacterium]|nr:hypothetical protein [bacterium]